MSSTKRPSDYLERQRKAHAMIRNLVPIDIICEKTGYTRDTVLRMVMRIHGRQFAYPGKKKSGRLSTTICWDCAKACCGCSWSRFYIPVEGWKATPTVIRNIQTTDVDSIQSSITSYKVIFCPEFEPDRGFDEESGFVMKGE